MYFCGESSCLQDDSNSSRGKEKTEVAEKSKDAAHMFGLGARYVNACLAKWDANKAHLDFVLKWTKSPHDMLVLLGVPHTGKTYFCAAIANYFIEQKKFVRYYNIRAVFAEIQKSFHGEQNQYEAMKKIAQSDILILDDVGASANTEWQKEMLLDLVDQRYSSKLPTIITTNLDKPNMEISVGERTARRVFSDDNLILTLGLEYVR